MVTIQLPPDFKEFVKLLNSHQVEYLLIGGYAVGYHGYPRATGDMDLWVAVRQNNAEKLVAVLREFGFNTPQLSVNPFLTETGLTVGCVSPKRIRLFASGFLRCELNF